ncbi:MAG TPA: prepilin peptidase, partial [Armatimonadota bacterium]|nr:prepilin peptidase [Armatimonadota bacterium]
AVWASLAARIPYVLPTVPGFILLVLALVWVSAMLVTFMIDLDTKYVIEPVTWLAMAAGLLFEVVLKWGDPATGIGVQVGAQVYPYLPLAVPGMIIGFLTFIAIDLFGALIFRKPSMGVGDAFIGAAIGAMLGPGLALLTFGMAVLCAVVIGVAVLLAQAARARRQAAAPAGEEPEPPRAYLPIVPFLGAAAALGVLWVIEVYSSAVLAHNYGHNNSLVALAAPIVFGALVIITLVLLEPLWPKQTVEDGGPEEEEELPDGNYIPFGPFLTGCAVLVALMPEQVAAGARALWDWYMHLHQ